MAISYVGAGTVATASGTSVSVTTPAGSIGDLVLFLLVADDYSDWVSPGSLAPISPPITLTQIMPSTAQYGGDFIGRAWWGIEDQAAGRAYSFGTASATEEIKGIALRFSGVVSAAPILSGTPTMAGGPALPSLTATKAGQWFVLSMFSDSALVARSAPSGWTERLDSSAANYSLYLMTKPVTTEQLALASYDASQATTGGLGYWFGFVLDVDSPTAYTVAGVTKDKNGSALGSCTVILFKDAGTNDWKQVASQASNATTGAYSFTVYDNAAKYMVVAYKGDTPHVFDVTDYVITPA